MEWLVCVWCAEWLIMLDVLKTLHCWFETLFHSQFHQEQQHIHLETTSNTTVIQQCFEKQTTTSVQKKQMMKEISFLKESEKEHNKINGIPSQSVFIPVSSFLIITCESHLMNWRINHTLENWLTNDTIWSITTPLIFLDNPLISIPLWYKSILKCSSRTMSSVFIKTRLCSLSNPITDLCLTTSLPWMYWCKHVILFLFFRQYSWYDMC